MIDLEPIPVDVEIGGVRANPSLIKIPVGEEKFAEVALQRRIHNQTLLVDDLSGIGLVFDVKVGWHDRQMRIDLERIAGSDPLIDRSLPVSADPDNPNYYQILFFVDVLRHLKLAPELVILAWRCNGRCCLGQ